MGQIAYLPFGTPGRQHISVSLCHSLCYHDQDAAHMHPTVGGLRVLECPIRHHWQLHWLMMFSNDQGMLVLVGINRTNSFLLFEAKEPQNSCLIQQYYVQADAAKGH